MPTPAVEWDFTVEGKKETVGYVGLDAFSVPIQGPGGKKSEHRMLYLGTLYTPDKSSAHYLVDFDLDRLGRQLRQASIALGFGRADRVVALSDAGNGLEPTFRGHFDTALVCILDWYHAAEHLHDYAARLHPGDGPAALRWAEAAKGVLWEKGGKALGEHLGGLPAVSDAGVAEEFRKLVGYFAHNEHRTDYPEYRARGWDVGSGPTEAGCKVVGARLKGSGMRWAEVGAEKVGPLRALHASGPETWDAYWSKSA